MAEQINPRYALWAKLHGNTPEQQLEKDRKRWPGGSMCGFILWIDQKAREYAKLTGQPREIAVLCDQEGFTEYLRGKIEEGETCTVCQPCYTED